MRMYMTHNGIKTVMSMRAEIASASGDVHWTNPYFHPDEEVMSKYVQLAKDGSNIAWVEPVCSGCVCAS